MKVVSVKQLIDELEMDIATSNYMYVGYDYDRDTYIIDYVRLRNLLDVIKFDIDLEEK